MGVLSLLLPVIPMFIQAAEALFKHHAPDGTPVVPAPKLGADKLDAVSQMIRQLIAALTAAKVPLPDGTPIPSTPVTDDALHATIETILAYLKKNNTLNVDPAAAIAMVPAGDVWVVRGNAVKVNV